MPRQRTKHAHLGEVPTENGILVFLFNAQARRIEWWIKGTRSRRHIRTLSLEEIAGGVAVQGDFTRGIAAAY